MHLSRFYVSRLLSRELRMGFSEYVNLLRVNRACDLLNDTDKKIADISEDAGFSTMPFLQPRFCAAYEHDADSVP